jgi:hypothetical protein
MVMTGGHHTVLDIAGDDVERTGVIAGEAPETPLIFEDGAAIRFEDEAIMEG